MPDLYTRLYASSKANAFGAVCTLLATAIYFVEVDIFLRASVAWPAWHAAATAASQPRLRLGRPDNPVAQGQQLELGDRGDSQFGGPIP
jgi:Na+/H+ antiporter subunit